MTGSVVAAEARAPNIVGYALPAAPATLWDAACPLIRIALESPGVARQSHLRCAALRCAIAVAIGVVLLHESLTASLAFGTFVIVAGMIMINEPPAVGK